MTQIVDAIYEGGLLRPIQPLDLKERQCVELHVRPLADRAEGQADGCTGVLPQMESTAIARQAALDEFFREADAMDLYLGRPLPTRDELHERR
jgi:predicted DNA-binding antitoxin AbrB/MazE fold protein